MPELSVILRIPDNFGKSQNPENSEHPQYIPVILGPSRTSHNTNHSFVQQVNVSKKSVYESDYDIGEAIRLRLFNNKNAVLTITILTLVVIVAMILSFVISSPDEDKNPTKY